MKIKTVINFLKKKTKQKYWSMRTGYEHTPFIATIELTSRCNARCLVGDTKILMANYSWKFLKDVSIGDFVIGVVEPIDGKPRKFIKSKVLETFPAIISEVGYLKLKNGIELGCTPNHKILSKHGRWIAANKLTNGDPPKWNATPTEYTENRNYLIGYLSGAWSSDGMIRIRNRVDGYTAYEARFAVKDEEFIDFVQYCMEVLELEFRRQKLSWNNDSIKEQISVYSKNGVLKLQEMINIPEVLEYDWMRGFLTGFYDGDGTFSRGNMIRIINTDIELIQIIQKCFERLNFNYSISKYSREKLNNLDVYCINLLGGLHERIRFLSLCQPKILRKGVIASSVRGTMEIDSFEMRGEDYVYNLETETGNYIANGFIVHNCTYCGRDKLPFIGDMSIDGFKKIIDAIPFTKVVAPWAVGESLLHKDVLEAIRYCKSKGKFVGISSNGQPLTEEMCKGLLEADLDELKISVDTDDAEDYEKTRIPLKWNKLVENVKRFRRIRDAGNYKTHIVVRMTETSYNREHKQRIMNFWGEIVDEVIYRNVRDFFPEEHAGTSSKEDVIKCRRITDEIVIFANGTVVMCCDDWYCNNVIGVIDFETVVQEDILKIFNGEKMNAIREAMRIGKDYPFLCDVCVPRVNDTRH